VDTETKNVTENAPGTVGEVSSVVTAGVEPLPDRPGVLLGRIAQLTGQSFANETSAAKTVNRLLGDDTSGSTAMRAVAGVLALLVGVRLVFDEMLPKLVLVALVGAIVIGSLVVVAYTVIEWRRQRALLECLSQLARIAEIEGMQADVMGHVSTVIDALKRKTRLPLKEQRNKS
jgi:hypothetical protein